MYDTYGYRMHFHVNTILLPYWESYVFNTVSQNSVVSKERNSTLARVTLAVYIAVIATRRYRGA